MDAELNADARRAALQHRGDILSALADYAASQSALQLEIAKQYPDVHLQPGYEFDQGDNKWSLGLTIELPVLNQNQGPIAEARAKREEAAAKFNAVQAKVLAEIDRAIETFRLAETNFRPLQLVQTQVDHERSIEEQVKAGAADQIELLNAQLETANIQIVALEAQIKMQQAAGALEDALQAPLLPASVFTSTRTDTR